MPGANYIIFFRRIQTWYSLVPWAIILITLLAISNINLKKGYQDGSMEADGKGYYAYLPAIFIYHDLSFGFYNKIERETYPNPNLYYEYLRKIDGKAINKYFAGTALCMLPFFAIGHLTTVIAGMPADGYSYYYMVWIHMGTVIYLLLGLFALRRLLRTYGFSEQNIALTLVVIVFGTNLFYYTLTEYSMSHAYSFAAITGFVLSVRNYFSHSRARSLLWIGFLLGVIVLIRPVNVIILLAIPFLAGSKVLFISGIKKAYYQSPFLLAAIVVFVLIASIQPIIYNIQTGNFLVYSYPGESFNFLQPKLAKILFSYRKGLFIYTPVTLLSLTGFVFLWKQSRYSFLTLSIFLFILCYMISSWHMWFYGGSFSQRVFIDFFAFFALLLAISFQNLKSGWLKNIYLSAIFVLVLFCQFQTYQYRHMVIHWSDMTKEKYWENFLKLNP